VGKALIRSVCSVAREAPTGGGEGRGHIVSPRAQLVGSSHDSLTTRQHPTARATSTDEYVQLFNSEMRRILDLHAPLKTRTRRAGRDDCRWLSIEHVTLNEDVPASPPPNARRQRRSGKPLLGPGLTQSPRDLPMSPVTMPPPGE